MTVLTSRVIPPAGSLEGKSNEVTVTSFLNPLQPDKVTNLLREIPLKLEPRDRPLTPS